MEDQYETNVAEGEGAVVSDGRRRSAVGPNAVAWATLFRRIATEIDTVHRGAD
jgi:hypothetical protein